MIYEFYDEIADTSETVSIKYKMNHYIFHTFFMINHTVIIVNNHWYQLLVHKTLIKAKQYIFILTI